MKTSDLVNIAKDYYIRSTTGAIKTVLATYLPFVKLPVISTIVNAIVDWIVKQSADLLELGSFFLYTDLRVNKEGREYAEAIMNKRKAEIAGTPEEKKNAEQEAIKAFITFAKFTNTRI